MKLLGLFAMAAMLFSCEKANREIIDPTPADQTEHNEDPSATDGKLLTSFGVTFEDAGTKVYVNIGTGETAIEENDEVLVFADKDNYATYKYVGDKFVIKEGQTAVSLGNTVSVFYPRDEFDILGDAVVFVMPHGIEASEDFGAINPMAGVITGSAGSYSVELGNIASVLRVRVSADVNINSVTLDYSSPIYYAEGGKFYINASEKTMTYANEHNGNNTETVDISPAKTADVLFIIPTVGLPGGLSVTANLADNHNGGANSFTVTNTSKDARARNNISTMSFFAGLFSGGSGTSADPYKISSARDLKYMATYMTNDYKDADGFRASDFRTAYYQQKNYIDAGNMTPIGSSSSPFSGNYDGKGNKINVAINATTQNTGVFGYLDNATISNLTVKGTVTSSETTVGGIAGASKGSHIINCTNEANVSTTSSAANAYVGGIVGNANQTDANEIVSCTNSGTITGNIFTGGITGDLLGTADMCINKGIVTSNNSNVGGITGSLRANSVVKRCYSANFDTSTGAPLVQGLFRVGGIVGIQNGASSQVVNCISRSSILGTTNSTTITSTAVGGIVGELRNGLVANCLAGASDSHIVNTKTANAYIGLIVGYIQSANGTVQNCYSRQVANNFGYFTYTTPNTWSRKTSAAGNTTCMGQVYGYNNGGTVKDCYYRGHTNGVATGGAKSGSSAINVTMISENVTTIFNDASANVPVDITLSNGTTTYGANTKKLWDILTGGAELITGYTQATDEVMGWEYKSGSEPAIPSEMVRLGNDFWNN